MTKVERRKQLKNRIASIVLILVATICCIPFGTKTYAENKWTYIDEEYVQYANEVGEMYGICPELIIAMMESESAGNRYATSPSGAKGLMQIIPEWHWDRMDRLGVTDLYDPYSNILVGVDFLAELAREYQDLPIVLMCYNEGPLQEVFEKIEHGYISEYAEKIMKRSSELQRVKEILYG